MISRMEAGEQTFDFFISHASEDKQTVARPLAEALTGLGWTVWLDELQLTIGDSLSGRIDSALAKSRFGVVVLSPAFFGKAWPERELAGLAAREIGSGSKVILPVWHEVDHAFIVSHSPVLADRLGARTSGGIAQVADELSQAVRAANLALAADKAVPDVGSGVGPGLIEIPVTRRSQEEVVRDRPMGWEYRLYAGVMLEGRIRLEDKWLDHELKLPKGGRESPDPDAFMPFMRSQIGWAKRRIGNLNLLFEPDVFERAFGAPGEPGDPERIEHVARGVIQIYESMLDWAASLRNVDVLAEYEELLELTARMLDGPIVQIREFIQLVADEIARIEITVAEANEGSPKEIHLTLKIDLEDGLNEEIDAALKKLAARID
jgi:hypothetical protein